MFALRTSPAAHTSSPEQHPHALPTLQHRILQPEVIPPSWDLIAPSLMNSSVRRPSMAFPPRFNPRGGRS